MNPTGANFRKISDLKKKKKKKRHFVRFPFGLVCIYLFIYLFIFWGERALHSLPDAIELVSLQIPHALLTSILVSHCVHEQ